MNLQDIQKLITMLEKSNLNEMELETGGTKIRLSKGPGAPALQSPPQFVMMPQASQAHGVHIPMQAAEPAVPMATGAAPPDAVPVPTAAHLKAIGLVEAKSPMVGTFYRSPAPGAEPFVKIGDRVRKGQTLCIIEAMKLMNEIECETDGVIVDVLTENAQPVEYGEVLMHIDPNG